MFVSQKMIEVLGYASGIAGAIPGSEKGPAILKNSAYLANLPLHWQAILIPTPNVSAKVKIVQQLNQMLSLSVANTVLEKKFFAVLGGDHTAAIGTWSGASHAKKAEGPIGLIWVDAHMDSHTPETSESGNLHGMPLACLLGYGETELTHLLNPYPKLQPENVCLIGVRSFEAGEAALLKKLNVRIFFMDEVKQKGIKVVLQEAIAHVTKHTCGYGMTIDIDSIDPLDAPGTGSQEPDGLRGQEFCESLTVFKNDERFLGVEIVEFNPDRDKNHVTEKLIASMISNIIQ